MATLIIRPAQYRTTNAARGPSRFAQVKQALGRVGRAVLRGAETVRAGRYLAEMDDHMLKDLGISRAQARFMATRPLLRAWWRG